MLPGPIFNLELLTSARRTRYFVIRALYASVLLAAVWLVYFSYDQSRRWSRVPADDIHSVAQLSAGFFVTFAWLQLLAVMVFAPAMVAGTIASERERRTIEYLFASQLSNAEIVLGKLGARLLHVFYMLLVGVPVLALMMMLGGIAPEALLALFIITLSSTVTACSMAMAISVWSMRAREAVTRAYLVLFVFLALPPLISTRRFATPLYGAIYGTYIAPVNNQLIVANPLSTLMYTIVAASGTARGLAFQVVWAMVRNQAILAALCAGAATLAVRRVHFRQRSSKARRRWRLMQRLRPEVGRYPMLWKELFAEPAAARLGWIGRIAVTLIVLGIVVPTFCVFLTVGARGVSTYRTTIGEYINYVGPMGTLLACGILLMIAARAAGSIASERERDCWTSLLSTPLEPGGIIWAKIAGGVWAMRGGILLLVTMWALGVLIEPKFALPVLFLFATFLALAFYAAALGVRYSLSCRTSLRAMGATLATGLFVGGLYLFCCIPVIASTSGTGKEMMIIAAPCIPFLQAIPLILFEEHVGPDLSIMMIATYVLGIIGYLVAAVCLAANSISRFDAANGRTGQDSGAIYRRSPDPALVACDRTRPVIPSSSIEVPAEAAVLAEQSGIGDNGG